MRATAEQRNTKLVQAWNALCRARGEIDAAILKIADSADYFYISIPHAQTLLVCCKCLRPEEVSIATPSFLPVEELCDRCHGRA